LYDGSVNVASTCSANLYDTSRRKPGVDPRGGRLLPKTYESNFIHHYIVQFGKQLHLRCKHYVIHCFVTGVLWNILDLSYSSETVLWDLTTKYYWIRLLIILTGSAPVANLPEGAPSLKSPRAPKMKIRHWSQLFHK